MTFPERKFAGNFFSSCVYDYQVILVHGFGQSLVLLFVHFAEAHEGLMIGEQEEVSSSEVMLEVFSTPQHTVNLH